MTMTDPHHLCIARAFVGEFEGAGVDYPVLLAAALEGIQDALPSWKPGRGSIANHARSWMRHRVLALVDQRGDLRVRMRYRFGGD